MTVTRHVTRHQHRDSRQTFDRYTEPTLTDPSIERTQHGYARPDEHLARILSGTFGTVDKAAGL